MNLLFKTFFAILLVAVGSLSARADDNFWLGVKAGTLGIGAEAIWRPLPWFDLRGGLNRFDYDETGSQSGINYDATLELSTLYATANFRVPLSPLRFTAGLFANDNELKLVSLESGSFDIGGTSYTSAEVGTLRSLTSFDSTSPYAGIGFDFGLFGKVGLNLDVGVLLQGDPKVSLSADGLLANDPTFVDALEAERVELEDEVDKFKAYPVLSLALNFQFL
jgi:hypothetical protein